LTPSPLVVLYRGHFAPLPRTHGSTNCAGGGGSAAAVVVVATSPRAKDTRAARARMAAHRSGRAAAGPIAGGGSGGREQEPAAAVDEVVNQGSEAELAMSAVVDTWIPFIYRGFHDVPRLIVTSWQGRRFVLACEFDDALDDYPSHYEVFVGEARDLDQDGWDSLVGRARSRSLTAQGTVSTLTTLGEDRPRVVHEH
jgi:hypothetical protein